MLDAVVVLRAVRDVVDLELYCGALLNGWLHRRATLAVSILEQLELEIDLLIFNGTTVSVHGTLYTVHRTLYLTTVSSHLASHARCWKRSFRANGIAKSNDLAIALAAFAQTSEAAALCRKRV